MILLALLRHAPTSWNKDGRLQGRADIPITEDARLRLHRRRVPMPMAGWPALSSPLIRCLQTAAALGLTVTPEPALIEMDWGAYQGSTVESIRRTGGADFRANEMRGLDFTPPQGESPRAVQRRLLPLLARLGSEGVDTLAVTHRGVMRALYARAVGWDMTGEPPHRLEFYDAIQVFRVDTAGNVAIEQLNLPLAIRSPGDAPRDDGSVAAAPALERIVTTGRASPAGPSAPVTVRRYLPPDAAMLRAVFESAVRETAAGDYDEAQIAAWLGPAPDAATWQSRLDALAPFVAEIAGEVVGYADLQSSGLIDHFFVAARAGRRGVGTALMRQIHAAAAARALPALFADVSVTARPFFLRWGFVEEAAQEVVRHGVTLRNYRMRKLLARPTGNDAAEKEQ